MVVREGENILERRRALGTARRRIVVVSTLGRGSTGSLHCTVRCHFCSIVGLAAATVEAGELGGVRSWHS